MYVIPETWSPVGTLQKCEVGHAYAQLCGRQGRAKYCMCDKVIVSDACQLSLWSDTVTCITHRVGVGAGAARKLAKLLFGILTPPDPIIGMIGYYHYRSSTHACTRLSPKQDILSSILLYGQRLYYLNIISALTTLQVLLHQ